MLTVPFLLTITNPEFGARAEAHITPDSESITTIHFTKPDGTKGLTATLVTSEIYPGFEFDADIAVYPIFIPGCAVEITFNFHPDTIQGSNIIFAYITVRSDFVGSLTRIHGL